MHGAWWAEEADANRQTPDDSGRARAGPELDGPDAVTAGWTIDTATCCRSHGGRFTVVHPGGPVTWPRPAAVGDRELDLRAGLSDSFPPAGVLEVPEATVTGARGWISVGDGLVLRDHTWYGDAIEEECSGPDPAERTVDLPGTTLSLLSDFAEVSYGHLVFDVLPRWSLLEPAGVALDRVDHVLCCAPPERRDYVLELGVPRDRIVWTDPSVAYRTDRLLAPSFPGRRRMLPSWAADALRSSLGVPPAGSGRRVFLLRDHDRRVVNDAEVRDVLRSHGLEAYDPVRSDEDQRAVFAAAELVVGTAGSALSTIVFCAPGAAVLELLPDDHPFPYHYTAAVAAGLRYRYLVGASEHVRADHRSGPSRHDFTVDVSALDPALAALTVPQG